MPAPSRKARINAKPANPADVDATWADISKAKRILGWSPANSPDEGFRRTVAWHVEHRELVRGSKV